MKSTSKFVVKIILFVMVSLVTFSSCKKEDKKNVELASNSYSESSNDMACIANPSWFPHSQTPAPKEGSNSIFATPKKATNIAFHQWSWQKFLWLTKPIPHTETLELIDKGVKKPFIILDSIPLFLSPKMMIEVDPVMTRVAKQKGATVVLSSINQAGSGGVLKSNPAYNSANNNAETIYYSIHISPTMMTAADGFIADMIAKKLPVDNFKTFPVGSLELKVSWVAAKAIDSSKRKNYYTTVGAITTDGGATYTNTEVALLGMHVVGVVENHPEFIWATFENNDLAPNYDRATNLATASDDKLLFAKGSTTGIDGILWLANDTISKTKVIPAHVKKADAAYDLFQYGVPRDASGNFMTTCQAEPKNFNNIQKINDCVAENLKDVWVNYFYNGSIWINTDDYKTTEKQAHKIVKLGYNIGSAKPDSIARGSLNAANVTMETFTQTFKSSLADIKVSNLANCFSCHSAVSFKKPYNVSPLYISHVFDGYVQYKMGSTKDEIEIMKDKQQILQILKTMK